MGAGIVREYEGYRVTKLESFVSRAARACRYPIVQLLNVSNTELLWLLCGNFVMLLVAVLLPASNLVTTTTRF